jgi:hypothetical protein
MRRPDAVLVPRSRAVASVSAGPRRWRRAWRANTGRLHAPRAVPREPPRPSRCVRATPRGSDARLRPTVGAVGRRVGPSAGWRQSPRPALGAQPRPATSMEGGRRCCGAARARCVVRCRTPIRYSRAPATSTRRRSVPRRGAHGRPWPREACVRRGRGARTDHRAHRGVVRSLGDGGRAPEGPHPRPRLHPAPPPGTARGLWPGAWVCRAYPPPGARRPRAAASRPRQRPSQYDALRSSVLSGRAPNRFW